MRATTFSIPAMDCPAEERVLRLALEPHPGVHGLDFDLGKRELTIYHEVTSEDLGRALAPTGWAYRLVADREGGAPAPGTVAARGEGRALRIALAINAALFLVEAAAGLRARSLGLLGDSLDMLADAMVYALGLLAAGAAAGRQRKVAAACGWLQVALALGGLVETVRRFFYAESPPEPWTMAGVSLLALFANVATLLTLARTKDAGPHTQATWICTQVDVQVNAGVMVAGVLVYATGSRLPDLAAGAVIFILVLRGARGILALAR